MDEMMLMRSMTSEQKEAFRYEMDMRRKNPDTALLLNIFGLHYAYLGNVGKTILLWLSTAVFIGFIWAFVDLFRVRGMTRQFNERIAEEVATKVRMLFPATPTTA